MRLVSASRNFLEWIKLRIESTTKIKGGWICKSKDIFLLSYGKSDSMKLLRFLYKDKDCICLTRKFEIAKSLMGEWRNWGYARRLGRRSERIVGSNPTSPTNKLKTPPRRVFSLLVSPIVPSSHLFPKQSEVMTSHAPRAW